MIEYCLQKCLRFCLQGKCLFIWLHQKHCCEKPLLVNKRKRFKTFQKHFPTNSASQALFMRWRKGENCSANSSQMFGKQNLLLENFRRLVFEILMNELVKLPQTKFRVKILCYKSLQRDTSYIE